MPALTKVYSFIEKVMEGAHDLGSNTLKIMLSNSSVTTSTNQKSDVTEISAGNGYSAGGATVTVTASSQTSGTYSLVANDVVITASGGSIGPFRYVVLYNDTHASDLVIGFADYGSSITLADGEALTIDWTTSILTAS